MHLYILDLSHSRILDRDLNIFVWLSFYIYVKQKHQNI